MIHSFDTNLAEIYGLEEAVIINNFLFWVTKNAANEKNFYEGRFWTYNSVEALSELFPYLSKKKIWRSIKGLEDKGVLITGNFNKKPYDRTKWYSFSDCFCSEHRINIDFPKMENAFGQNGQIDLPDMENPFTQKGTPIPDSKPDSKTTMSVLVEQILDGYNEIVKSRCQAKGFFKDVFLKDKTRMKPLLARIRESEEHQSLDFWIAYFDRCCDVHWIRDGIDGKSVCTVDMLFNKTKFYRLVEDFWA